MCIIQNKWGCFTVYFAEDDKLVTKTLDIVTRRVVKYMIVNTITLSTAESCTGGMLSQMITSISGSSNIFIGGLCTYTEDMKMKLLGVKKETLDKYTVYSEQVASEMSKGVMSLTGSKASIGVTGLAGPNGGTKDKPVGTVYVSVRYGGDEVVRNLKLFEEYERIDRKFIRIKTTEMALEMLMELCKKKKVED